MKTGFSSQGYDTTISSVETCCMQALPIESCRSSVRPGRLLAGPRLADLFKLINANRNSCQFRCLYGTSTCCSLMQSFAAQIRNSPSSVKQVAREPILHIRTRTSVYRNSASDTQDLMCITRHNSQYTKRSIMRQQPGITCSGPAPGRRAR